jgi:ubiquitin-conjugating enzyme E2 S
MEGLSSETLRRVMQELKDLVQSPPDGIRVLFPEEDISEIVAFIDGPVDTPFAGGTFKMKLKLGPDFPQAPPKGVFLTKIFHPNVSKSGEICVNTLKKDWNPDLGIKHILLTIKCLLINPNPESALNEEAGKLLLERYEDYFKHAQLMTSIHAIKKGTNAVSTHNLTDNYCTNHNNNNTNSDLTAKRPNGTTSSTLPMSTATTNKQPEKENVPRNNTPTLTSAKNNPTTSAPKKKGTLKRL